MRRNAQHLAEDEAGVIEAQRLVKIARNRYSFFTYYFYYR